MDLTFGSFLPEDLQIEPKVQLPSKISSNGISQEPNMVEVTYSNPGKEEYSKLQISSILPSNIRLESIVNLNQNQQEWTFVDDSIQFPVPSLSNAQNGSKSEGSKEKNWAKLFAGVSAPPSITTNKLKKGKPEEAKKNNDLQPFEVALHDYSNNQERQLQLRGLVNERNKCFMNVVLQTLISCSPFLRFLHAVNRSKIPNKAPILQTFTRFYKEFEPLGIREIGSPFTPSYFYPLLNQFNPNYSTQHIYQEDAQEFLSFLLDRMHEEIVAEMREKGILQTKSQDIEEEEIEDWQEVGKGNKTSIIITKEDVFTSSPITEIFGGKLRSNLKKHNSKLSVSIQPFFCLHLDIQHPSIRSLEDALNFFASPESLEGVKDSKTKLEVEASRHTTLEALPKVLIFHLKRFAFAEGPQKVDKFITFPTQLILRPQFVSSKIRHRKYRLLGVVSHHGKYATNGHYTCDIKQQAGHWIHFDDATLHKTTEEQVLRRNAYILVYGQENT